MAIRKLQKATIKTVKTYASQDPVVSKFQQNIATTLAPLSRVDLLSGFLLTDITLVTGSLNAVPHKLGRDFKGWIVVRKNSESDVWENTAQTIKNKFISLECSANTTISLWVF